MAPPKPDPKSLFHHLFVRPTVGLHTFWYRLTGGLVGGRMGTAPILLLTTVGRRSGRRRTLPLLYFETDRGYGLIASYGGSDTHPSWYLNLREHPRVEIQVGPKRMRATAETVTGERRAELWSKATRIYPGYDTYQSRTEREIPVVELLPAA